MTSINFLSLCVIMSWAIWSALSYRVKDGIVGKLIFFAVALSTWALLVSDGPNLRAETTLHACIAAYCLRAVFMKYAWRWFISNILCQDCPYRRADDL